MKPTIAISILLLLTAGIATLGAQPAAANKTVLILLRQPEGTLGKRLAEIPASATVPEEIRSAATREQASMAQVQQDSFEQRLTARGATCITRYPELNMLRADVPGSALTALQSDPAVVSVTPLSEDTQAVARVKPPPLPPATLGAGVPPPPPPLMQMPGMQMPGMPMPGMPGNGGMTQSLLGVAGQMGMQAGGAMPRAAGLAMLLSGTAQLAQVILANRKLTCTMTLETVGKQVPEAGGQGVIAVNAPPTCLWQARSDSDWLQINTDEPMMGPGIVKYTVAAAKSGLLRTGVINMEGVANVKVKGKFSVTVRQGM